MLAQIGNQTPGQRYSQIEKLTEKVMDLIEWVDVKVNLLANAYYAKTTALRSRTHSSGKRPCSRWACLWNWGHSR